MGNTLNMRNINYLFSIILLLFFFVPTYAMGQTGKTLNKHRIITEAAIGNSARQTAICDASCKQILQGKLDAYRLQHNIPGMSMTISIGENKFINFYSGHHENLAINPNAAKVNEKSLFEIGSITKSFIAAVILQLEAEKKLSLEDKIDKWLPEIILPANRFSGLTQIDPSSLGIPRGGEERTAGVYGVIHDCRERRSQQSGKPKCEGYKDEKWGNIKIRQLLNMTSGIPDYTFDKENFETKVIKDPTHFWHADELINIVYPKLDFIPGTSWRYSNTGYILAGKIIEKVTGHSIAYNLKARIFHPLQLSSNTIKYDPAIVPMRIINMVHGYSREPSYFDHDTIDVSTSVYNAAGGIISTSQDIAIWIRALFSGKVLAPQQFKEMTSLVCMNSGGLFNKCVLGSALPNDTNLVGYGLGVGRYPAKHDHRAFWNYLGSTAGYFSAWYYAEPSLIATSLHKDFLISFCGNIDANSAIDNSIKDLALSIYSYFYSH